MLSPSAPNAVAPALAGVTFSAVRGRPSAFTWRTFHTPEVALPEPAAASSLAVSVFASASQESVGA